MPQADGTILIDTEINADGMKAGSKEVEAAVRRMAHSVDDLGTKARTALNKQVDSFSKLNKEYAAQAQKVDDLKKKVAQYGAQKIPTAEYREIQAQIDQATKRMNQLIAAQERYLNVGGKSSSSQYKRMQYDIDELANTIKYAKGELKDIEETGKAFTLGNKSKQATADMEKLAAAERKLADMNNRLGTSYSSIKGLVNDYNNSLLKSSSAQQKATTTGNRLNKTLKNTGKSANSANFGLGKMLGTSILFSFVFQAISGVMNAMKEGFTNLAQYSSSTNNSISMLWSSLERLKNSLATAFAPILDVVAPILSKFIDMLSTAASYVSMFFAFLSGKSTYTRAVAVQKDYAASLEDTASGAQDAAEATDAAAEAAEGYLSPLDEINKLDKNNTSSGGAGGSSGGGTGGDGTGPLFEEVPIDNKFSSLLDSVIDKLKEIKDIFMSGFWDGLGDYKPLLEELKKDLSSIGSYLTDIFTDSDVKAAAKKFAKAFIYNLGKIAGSFAKVGLTIATNIVGGIESFLKENVNRIKKYLISMFDIGTEVVNTIGNLAQTISDIFSDVFGSQVAQDLTGDIIGFFFNIFMGITELAFSFGRDLVNLIAQPIIENKDKIKNALLGTLKPIESVFQGIEDLVKSLVDKLILLYTEHIKPFIDSLANGISYILGIFLDGYNEYIVPILDSLSQKIVELMEGPLGEAINSIITFLGKLFDALKLLWEEVLVPLLAWIIENVMPILGPIIEFLGTTVIAAISAIITAISGIFDVLSGLIDFIVGVFTGDWELAFQGLSEIAEGFKTAFDAIFGFIENNILEPFDKFLSGVFSTDWTKSFGVLGNVLNAFFKSVQNIWNSVRQIFDGIIQFIDGVFSGNWRQAWDGIIQIFKGIWNTLVGVVKAPVNGVISIINSLLDVVEAAQHWIADALSFSISLPGWVQSLTGASSFSLSVGKVNIPRIPYLASGAVIPPNNEFIAVLGDQKRGNNIEAPEGLIRKIIREELSRQNAKGGSYAFTAQINRRTLFEEFIKEAELQQMRTGKNPLELT